MNSIKVDLAQILNQLDILAAIIDEEFNIIMVNDKIKELFGDVVGRKCYRVFHSASSPPEYCAIVNLLRGKGGEEEFYESSIGKWLRVRVSKLKIDDSTVFLHFAEDFTERKKFEEELKEREMSFRALAENSIAGVFIYQEDRVVYCNSALERLTGYSKEEILKMPFWKIIHPDFRDEIVERNRKGMVEPTVRELPYHTKSGEPRLGLFSFSTTVYRSKPAGVVIFFDITEKKRMMDELSEREMMLRSLFESAKDVIYILSPDGKIVDVNPAIKEFGYESGEVVGKHIYELFTPESKQKYVEKFPEFLEKGYIRHEVDVVSKDGKSIPIDCSASAIYDKEGNLKFIVSIHRDISQQKEMEKKLKKSEEKYRDLWENANDMFYIHDLSGNFIDANKAALETFEYSTEDIKNTNIKDIIDEDYINIAFKKIQEILATEKSPKPFEVLCHTKSGRKIWVEVRARPILEDGNVVAIQGIARDITERKKMEEKLKDSEMLYRTLVEKTHDAVYLLGRSGFIFVNDNVCKLTNYSKDELYKIDPLSLIHPEDRNRVRDYLTKRFRGENAPESHISRVVTKYGDVRYCEFSVKPIMYKGKRVVLGSVRDITERKLMEDKLRESEKRYRTLVETINDIVFMLDVNGRFKYLNKKFEEITGYRVEEMLEKHFAEILAPEYVESTVERFKKGLAGEDVPLYEIEILAKDGKRVPVELNVTNLYDEEGNAVGRLGVARNITERKRMEENLMELNNSLRLINKIMRHDILNDLTIVNAALEVYKETKDEKMLNKAFRAIERSVKLINQMKELEELTTNRELGEYNVREVIEEIVGKYPEIEFKIEGDCRVLADGTFNSVIDNIINNAVVHGKTNRIDIMIKCNDFCEIRIADYGKGIPEKIKDRIFEEGFFYGETGHTGLGLYIVKRAIERYGGNITIEDNKPKGTVFVIRLRTVK